MERAEILANSYNRIIKSLDEMDGHQRDGGDGFDSKGQLIKTAGMIRDEYHNLTGGYIDEHDGVNDLYRVAVDCLCCKVGPHRVTVLVVAKDGHEALDRATEHSNAYALWDEEIQRDIVDGVLNERTIERNYSDYIETVEFVGEL